MENFRIGNLDKAVRTSRAEDLGVVSKTYIKNAKSLVQVCNLGTRAVKPGNPWGLLASHHCLMVSSRLVRNVVSTSTNNTLGSS